MVQDSSPYENKPVFMDLDFLDGGKRQQEVTGQFQLHVVFVLKVFCSPAFFFSIFSFKKESL